MKGSKYMLVHSLASKYAIFVVLGRPMYWTPPPIRPFDPPLLKSDDLFFREPRDIGPPPFKNPGHAPEHCRKIKFIYVHQTFMYTKCEQCHLMEKICIKYMGV